MAMANFTTPMEILRIVFRGNFILAKYHEVNWFAINAMFANVLDHRIFFLELKKITFLICTKREEGILELKMAKQS